MRTAVYYSNREIRIEERPRPKAGTGELVVRVEAAGICGSDVMEWYRIGRVPLVLGHEVGGVVEEAGEGVRDFRKGDRVALAHHVPCGFCRYCASGHETVCETLRKTNFDPGGFSEFLRLEKIHVEKGTFLLPDAVSFEEATFVEPLACVLRGQRSAGLKAGKSLLVIGSGIAGLLHIHLGKVSGAAPVAATDISSYRVQQAERFGADRAFPARDYTPELLRSLNNGSLADVVVVTSGAPSAIEQAFNSVERGGTILFFAPTQHDAAIPLPFNKLFWRTEITLSSSYAGSPADYRKALELIAGKRLNLSEMITHTFPLSKTQEGFRLVAEAGESIKVIVYPQK